MSNLNYYPKRPDRLVEYFVVVGLGEDVTPLQTDSEQNQSITDICISSGENGDWPNNYEVLDQTLYGSSANLYSGLSFQKHELFLCFTRIPIVDAVGTTSLPITDIILIHSDAGETCPLGYQQLHPSLNSWQSDHQTYLCFTRDRVNAPIIDLQIISTEAGVWGTWTKIIHCVEVFPLDYIRVTRPLPSGRFLSTPLYLCYSFAGIPSRKSPTSRLDLPYQTHIVDRYPFVDRPDFPLPPHIALITCSLCQFCHPQGARIVLKPPEPSTHSFVLTTLTGLPVYGCCLTFYEPLRPDQERRFVTKRITAMAAARRSTVSAPALLYAPVSLALISYWPFLLGFKHVLTTIFRVACLSVVDSDHDTPLCLEAEGVVGVLRTMPVESLLSNLWETPLPRTSHIAVRLHISAKHAPVVFAQLPQDDFPFVDYHFAWLFRCLSFDTILVLLCALLAERKVLLSTRHPALLTPVAEAAKALMFPFRWQHTYIPVLPINIHGIFQAPNPLLVGMHTVNLERGVFTQSDVVVFDLDRDSYRCCREDAPLPTFPDDLRKSLLVELNQYAHYEHLKRFTLDEFANFDLAYPDDVRQRDLESAAETAAASLPLAVLTSHVSVVTSAVLNRLGTVANHLTMRGSVSVIDTPTTKTNTSPSIAISIANTETDSMHSMSAVIEGSTSSSLTQSLPCSGVAALSPEPVFDARAAQACFLHVFVRLLSGYRTHLNLPLNQSSTTSAEPVTTPPPELGFAQSAWIASAQSTYRTLLSVICSSQYWSCFVEDFMGIGDPSRSEELRFFSDSLDYEQSLLLFQERHQSTLFASLFNGVLGRSSSSASATPTTTTGLFGMRILAETTLQPPSLVHHVAQRRFTRDIYRVPAPQYPLLGGQKISMVDLALPLPRRFPKLNSAAFAAPRLLSVLHMTDVPPERKDFINREFEEAFIKNQPCVTTRPVFCPARFITPGAWVQHLQQQLYGSWFRSALIALGHTNTDECAMPNSTVEAQLTAVFDYYHRLVEHDVTLDEDTFRTVLIICGRYRRTTEANAVFELMQQRGTPASTLSCTAYALAVMEAGGSASARLPPLHELHQTNDFLSTDRVLSDVNVLASSSAAPVNLVSEKLLDDHKTAVEVSGWRIAWDLVDFCVGEVCSECQFRLHIEEIMAGWDDNTSSFSARCVACEKWNYTPTLRLRVPVKCTCSLDSGLSPLYRDVNSAISEASILLQIECPLLSPLVLRRELEAISIATNPNHVNLCSTRKKLERDCSIDLLLADMCASSCTESSAYPWLLLIAQPHRTLFWNCLWYFSFVLKSPASPLFICPRDVLTPDVRMRCHNIFNELHPTLYWFDDRLGGLSHFQSHSLFHLDIDHLPPVFAHAQTNTFSKPVETVQYLDSGDSSPILLRQLSGFNARASAVFLPIGMERSKILDIAHLVAIKSQCLTSADVKQRKLIYEKLCDQHDLLQAFHTFLKHRQKMFVAAAASNLDNVGPTAKIVDCDAGGTVFPIDLHNRTQNIECESAIRVPITQFSLCGHTTPPIWSQTSMFRVMNHLRGENSTLCQTTSITENVANGSEFGAQTSFTRFIAEYRDALQWLSDDLKKLLRPDDIPPSDLVLEFAHMLESLPSI